jgi:hypothetical protein
MCDHIYEKIMSNKPVWHICTYIREEDGLIPRFPRIGLGTCKGYRPRTMLYRAVQETAKPI